MYKLLIADDEHLIRNGLESIAWGDVGFEVAAVAANGKEALALIEGDAPDAVVTDIRMPIMDGIELIGILKERYPRIKVVALSGYNDFAYAQKCIEYRVFSYILKPINEKELRHVFAHLREELDNRQAERHEYRNGDLRLTPEERFFAQLVGNSFAQPPDANRLRPDGLATVAEDYQCIVAFSWEHADRDRDTSERLKQSRQYWGKYRFPVLAVDHTFLVLLHSRTKMYPKDIRIQADRFKAFMEEDADGAIGIGLGNVYPMDHIGASHNEALYALNYRFFAGKGSVVAYDEISRLQSFTFDNAALKKMIEDLAHHVLEGDGESAKRIVRELFWDVLHKSCSDTNLFLLKCVEVYVSLVTKIEQTNPSVKAVPVDDFYYQLSACHHFEQVAAHFKQTITGMAEQMNRLQANTEHSLITRLKDYLRKNYNHNISLAELSDSFFINPSYLSTLFKKETGINFSDYTIQLRIDNAKSLLKHSDLSIQEISEKVGYTDYRYFCTVFKKLTGDTPLKYRMKSIL
ncbi:MAG: response regulator [Paenibacillaceae bacterium]|nr:response regulator [Paenibacillaceae bacterium]